MRKTIKEALTGIIPVYDQNIITAETLKPYAILTAEGGEQDTTFNKAYNSRFILWLYVESVTFAALDNLIETVLASLTNTLLTTSGGKIFELTYTNRGTEFIDDDFNAYGVDLHFSTIDRIL